MAFVARIIAETCPADPGGRAREREGERKRVLHLGDPRDRLDVNRVYNEQESRDPRRTVGDPQASQEMPKEECVQHVEPDADGVVPHRVEAP